jgi:mannose-6-phosphate isomerase-like protein (cupin superfamily)
MIQHENSNGSGRFDLYEIAKSFPETADTLLLDKYLSNEETASVRVFRAYRPLPPHYHETCGEQLYVLSGKGTFWIDSPESEASFSPGQLLVFKRRTVHCLPRIVEGPAVFLAIDTPRRDPRDVIFVNPEDGTPESFIRGV